jgi:hypothetical protein
MSVSQSGRVHLVQVDVAGIQPPEAGFDLAHDRAARATRLVDLFCHGQAELGGQDDIVAAAFQRLADDGLRFAARLPIAPSIIVPSAISLTAMPVPPSCTA